MFQALMEAIPASGSCLFTSYPFFPSYVFDHPNSPITRFVTWVLPYLGVVIKFINQNPKLFNFNLFLLPHTKSLGLITGMHTSLGGYLEVGERGYNTERMANMVLGQKPGADTLPKRITDERQNPNDDRTRVPLDRLLHDYYDVRRWVNGVPTRKVLKKLNIDIPPHEVFPYSY